ncbi:MAG: proline--tRNA ligase [Candidatus Eiseniibacteriota bacterium]|nr:MAG: proline--tRNA ligase [Candidatus Eisenbacteria bacterium]
MRWTQAFIPTLKEDPADAEISSHKLMVRAGLVRKLTSGVYTHLPLGLRAIQKVERIVREEMDRTGALETLLPILHPCELWKESGRWDVYGKELMRPVDRHGRECALGPTHEEVITDLVRREVRSYRELPVTFYQIQTKFRDEVRPRFGVVRSREFIMKDAYSFHEDEKSLRETYKVMHGAYTRIFERCGLKFAPVHADSGAIGGDVTHEFMVLAGAGESEVVSCGCGYSATLERGETAPEKPSGKGVELKPLEKVHTPGLKTVEEVAKFLKTEPSSLIKTLLYEAEGETVAALIPGDRELNEAKLRRVLKVDLMTMCEAEAIEKATGGPLGFSGPVGLEKMRLVADPRIKNVKNFVVGANEADYHHVNANLERDFKVNQFADLVVAEERDPCVKCGKPVSISRGIEVGQIFELGSKYSEKMGAMFLGQDGKERPFVMGCYGIGITRTVAAVIEQNHDSNGIIWPLSVAPYQMEVLPVNVNDETIRTTAERLYEELTGMGFEVLLDDRDQRPGFKFKDADLVGLPLRVVVGEKAMAEGKVEIHVRRTGETMRASTDEAPGRIKTLIEEGKVS